MAKIIYYKSGKTIEVTPKDKKKFKLEEMQEIVGGYIKIISFDDDTVMVVNESGMNMGLDINHGATLYLRKRFNTIDFIVGDVLICHSKQVE